MGRTLLLCPAQSHSPRSTEPAIIVNMQNHHHHHHHSSHAQIPQAPPPPPSPTPPPPVSLRKDAPHGERSERRGRDRKLRIALSGVGCDYDRDAGKPDSDLPDVFEDCLTSCPRPPECSDPNPGSATVQQQQQQQRQHCEDRNSVENIPPVPDIVIQYAITTPVSDQRPAVPATSTGTALRHSDPPVGLFAKKGRTHSDSVIYESELKKQCLLSSFSGSPRSLSCTPSDRLACEDVSALGGGGGGSPVCDTAAETAAASESTTSDRDDGRVTFGASCGHQKKSQFLKPISWNFCRLDQFTSAEEKSPKLYWLRRHSDSTVSNGDDDKDAPEAADGRCSASRPERIGEIERESVGRRTMVGGEDSEKEALHRCGGVPAAAAAAEGRPCTPDERRKCLKVKKYLQTRYQNQLIDMDDVFMDVATDHRPEEQEKVLQNLPVAEVGSKSLPSRELTDSSRGDGNAEATVGSVSKSSNGKQGFLLLSDAAEFEDSSKNVRGRFPPRADDDDDVRRFQNDVIVAPVTSLLPARQTIFDFSFAAAAYSVLGDVSADCFGGANVVFGLLPQNCFPTTTTTTPAFVSSPLSADNISSFSLNSSSSVPVSVSADLVSESRRWPFGGLVDSGDFARRRRSKKRTDHSSGGGGTSLVQSSCDLDSPSPSSGGQRRQSSNNSTDGATRSGKNDADAPTQMLLCPSLSSSPSVAVTPTSKSCPQVVFDYQFSERINEQRHQAAGDAAGGSSFVCPVCSSVHPSYNSLANHVVSHLPSEVITTADGPGGADSSSSSSSKVHLCRVCNRSFSRSDMLSRHMRLHTGLRPYECHLCQQVFSRSDHLHTHLRTHTGEKPYRCSHCLYAASRRDMVTRHMRIHVRGGGKRGRRSSSTSSLASEAGQTSDDNGVFDNPAATNPAAAVGHHGNHQTGRPTRRRPVASGGGGGGKAGGSLQRQRNWSVASADNNDAAAAAAVSQEFFEDRDLHRMTRTESTTSVDSGVSYLTPRSLVPSLWSPGIDSPDVFSRYPGHFLWPSSTGSEIKHDLDRSAATNVSSSRDTDFEMQTSFQKCQVVSPLEQRFSVNSNELLSDQQRGEECV